MGINLSTTFMLCGSLLLITTAHAQEVEPADACMDVLTTSEVLFFNAQFEQAARSLNECLNAYDFQAPQRAEIYLLLARIHFAAQNEPQAAESIEKLFALNPDYTAEPPLPPPFIAFVDQIREIYLEKEVLDVRLLPTPEVSEEKKTNNKRWLWIGGGGLFAITAVALMSGGDSSDQGAFPPPPDTPR